MRAHSGSNQEHLGGQFRSHFPSLQIIRNVTARVKDGDRTLLPRQAAGIQIAFVWPPGRVLDFRGSTLDGL